MFDDNAYTRVIVRTRGAGKNQDQNHGHTFERAIVTLKDRPRHVVVDEEDGTRTIFPWDIVRKIVVHTEPGSASKTDTEETE